MFCCAYPPSHTLPPHHRNPYNQPCVMGGISREPKLSKSTRLQLILRGPWPACLNKTIGYVAVVNRVSMRKMDAYTDLLISTFFNCKKRVRNHKIYFKASSESQTIFQNQCPIVIILIPMTSYNRKDMQIITQSLIQCILAPFDGLNNYNKRKNDQFYNAMSFLQFCVHESMLNFFVVYICVFATLHW